MNTPVQTDLDLLIEAEALEALRQRAKRNALKFVATRVNSALLVHLIENYVPPSAS